jgi:hypothetical protein
VEWIRHLTTQQPGPQDEGDDEESALYRPIVVSAFTSAVHSVLQSSLLNIGYDNRQAVECIQRSEAAVNVVLDVLTATALLSLSPLSFAQHLSLPLLQLCQERWCANHSCLA